jgi:hypothetical protein
VIKGKDGLGKTLQGYAQKLTAKSEASQTDSSRAKETLPFPSVPRRCPVAGGSLALAGNPNSLVRLLHRRSILRIYSGISIVTLKLE